MKTSISYEVVALSALRRNPKAVKNHSEEQIEQLRASIRRFGFSDPIGVDAEYQIVEGEGRYLAAVAEGLEEVPVVRLDHLTGAERDAYAIAHNQTQLLTGLDIETVQGELGRLEVGEEEYTALGFSEADVLFLGFDDSGPDHSAELTPDTATETDDWNSLIQPVIKSSLRFTDRTKYVQFVSLLEGLGGRFPTDARVSQRLLSMVRERTANDPH